MNDHDFWIEESAPDFGASRTRRVALVMSLLMAASAACRVLAFLALDAAAEQLIASL